MFDKNRRLFLLHRTWFLNRHAFNFLLINSWLWLYRLFKVCLTLLLDNRCLDDVGEVGVNDSWRVIVHHELKRTILIVLEVLQPVVKIVPKTLVWLYNVRV